jgi:triacylglycerol lipase
VTEPKKCQNCTVHVGFWTSWKNSRDTVLSAVTEAREKYLDYEVTLIGHSLGGAVAALASLEMYSRGLDPHITTFGEPKVGNDKMADFINDMFDLSKERGDNDAQMRYRRITHVNDPVPLLPLTEWGYVPHAGEIYISKLDLPPSREDVEHCTGNTDKRCIASSEGDGEEEKVNDFSLLALNMNQQQEKISSSADDQQLAEKEKEVKTQWSLVPARYRIWELLFAHRDYFWRIGLCVPGGDPSSWRW